MKRSFAIGIAHIEFCSGFQQTSAMSKGLHPEDVSWFTSKPAFATASITLGSGLYLAKKPPARAGGERLNWSYELA